MIRKIETDGAPRFEVYGMKPPCTSACKHKECATGRTRKAYVGSFGSRKEAEGAERRHVVMQEQIASGELAPETDAKRTLRQAVGDWLDSLAKGKSRSHEGYTDRMNLYVLPVLGDVPLSRLTKPQIMRWRDDLSQRLAPATVNGSLTCLSSALTSFVDLQWIAENPAHGVAHIEAPERPYTWLQSKEEITKLLCQCPGDVRDIVALALGSGLRLDECLHLRYIDLDLERRLIHVHRGRKGAAKSGKIRRVPILDCILPMLRKRALKRDGAELLFPGKPDRRGNVKERSQAGVRDTFKLARDRAGLDAKLRFHDLRHTFASHWVMNAGCIFALSKLLGHHSVTVTEKFYAHLRPDHWERDYGRVAFAVPHETAVYEFMRGEGGKLTERVLRAVS